MTKIILTNKTPSRWAWWNWFALTELIVPVLDISGLNVELNLMDNDVVDESNLAHQRFSREDKTAQSRST